MKQHVLTIAIIILMAAGVKAQSSRFSIGAGYQRTWIVDAQASPLKYQTSEKSFLLRTCTKVKKENWMPHSPGQSVIFSQPVFKTVSGTIPVITPMVPRKKIPTFWWDNSTMPD